MANILTGNPWILDTATAGADLHSAPYCVQAITYQGAALATDKCVITDGMGRIFFEAAGADKAPVALNLDGTILRGLKVTALPSGRVVVFVE